MGKEKYTAADNRYEKMQYRRCGASGLLLPAVSLGLWHNFGSVDKYKNYSRIAFTAFDHGITHFDLANNYGPAPGSAEVNFGKILRDGLGAYRDQLIISTKAGYDMWPGPYGNWGSRKYLMASLDQSLRRMGLDYVDIFYSHRPDPQTPLDETMGALSDIVRRGKALYAGISNYDPDHTRRAVEILRRNGTPCLIHQVKYSMFERFPEQGLTEVLRHEGVGLIAFSPLAQGLLTDRYLDGIPEGSRAARSTGFLRREQVSGEVIEKVGRLDAIASGRGQTLAQMAIAWLLRSDITASVLVGASSPAQLEDNLGALEQLHFTDAELAEIEAVLGRQQGPDAPYGGS
ncbi:MAG: aldo/keto reductase [Rikenellaceae bacterium]|nr:aldo/keto reductase [Rikenellaceae bacterium]